MSQGLNILRGGYLSFDQLFLGTDHRGIWVDVSFVTAFGHTMPPIVKPKARRLQCQDPRLVENFTRRLNKLFLKHNLLEKFKALHEKTTYPMPMEHQLEFNTLNALRHSCVKEAESKCQKLRMGQVEFSPTLQLVRTRIYAWTLLSRRTSGQKVSSRLIQ